MGGLVAGRISCRNPRKTSNAGSNLLTRKSGAPENPHPSSLERWHSASRLPGVSNRNCVL